MRVGHEPQGSAGAQHFGGPGDEGPAERLILGAALVEGRIHDDEVEAAGHEPGVADIGPQDRRPRIGNVAAGHLDGAAVDLHQGHGRDGFRGEDRPGQDPEAAAEVGPPPFRDGSFARSRAVPGSSRSHEKTPGCVHRARLSTWRGLPSSIASAIPAGSDGRSARQIRWWRRGWSAAAHPKVVSSLASRAPPLSFGARAIIRPAGPQGAQDLRQHVAPLDCSGRREHGGGVEAVLGQILERAARNQWGNLDGIAGDLSEIHGGKP